MSLRLIPVTIAEANQFVGELHRHSDPVVGHRFSLGVENAGRLVGVAIVETPKARMSDRRVMAEVTRVCTDGSKNACSILYAACARAALAMGYTKIKTFVLESEPGTSVEAAGWVYEETIDAEQWDRPSRGRRRKLIGTVRKKRYVKQLRAAAPTNKVEVCGMCGSFLDEKGYCCQCEASVVGKPRAARQTEQLRERGK